MFSIKTTGKKSMWDIRAPQTTIKVTRKPNLDKWDMSFGQYASTQLTMDQMISMRDNLTTEINSRDAEIREKARAERAAAIAERNRKAEAEEAARRSALAAAQIAKPTVPSTKEYRYIRGVGTVTMETRTDGLNW